VSYHYRLVYRGGDDAGDYESRFPDWSVGDVLRTDDGRTLRIVRLIPLERLEEFVDEPSFAVLEVEPARALDDASRGPS
jgi:hypothetical protein